MHCITVAYSYPRFAGVFCYGNSYQPQNHPLLFLITPFIPFLENSLNFCSEKYDPDVFRF